MSSDDSNQKLAEPAPDAARVNVSISEAATEVEVELDRFEQLAQSLARLEINSEKSLARAGRSLAEALDCHARIVERLTALGAAMIGAQERQQRVTRSIEESAGRVQRRSAEFGDLVTGLTALGEEARAITELLHKLAPAPGAPKDTAASPDFASRFEEAIARMDRAVDHARELHKRAITVDMADVARQADSLHQQLSAARNRLRTPGT